jgi:hypothetical protein
MGVVFVFAFIILCFASPFIFGLLMKLGNTDGKVDTKKYFCVAEAFGKKFWIPNDVLASDPNLTKTELYEAFTQLSANLKQYPDCENSEDVLITYSTANGNRYFNIVPMAKRKGK